MDGRQAEGESLEAGRWEKKERAWRWEDGRGGSELLNSLEQRIHEQVSKQNYFQESFLNSKKMWIIDFLWSLDLNRKLSI